MSRISEHAHVSLLMSDHANVDDAGKLNVIGGGLVLLGSAGYQDTTPRFCLTVGVGLSHDFLPADFALEIALINEQGVVSLPTDTGESQPVRIANNISLERAQGMPNIQIRDYVGARSYTVLDFNNGLPLTPATAYAWRVSIDGDTGNASTYPFAVAGAPSGPVVG